MEKSKILVWDLPTRVFHWLLAASFAGAYVTSESGRYRDVHLPLGYTVLGLIAFRLLWGLLGTRYARFASFTFGPRKVVTYLKSLLNGTPAHYVGHNPAGSWSVYALLSLGMLTGITGYATYVGMGGGWLGEVHEAMANAMLAVVIVHVAGVVISGFLHRENLVKAMVSGYKRGRVNEGISSRRGLIAGALSVVVLAFWTGGFDHWLGASWNEAKAAQEHHAHDHDDD